MGEADGGEGGKLAVAEKARAPKDTDELLDAIATQDYGVSNDRSSKLATPAIKAYNKVVADDHRVLQTRGQALHEGFTIVKVRAARLALGVTCLIWQPMRMLRRPPLHWE